MSFWKSPGEPWVLLGATEATLTMTKWMGPSYYSATGVWNIKVLETIDYTIEDFGSFKEIHMSDSEDSHKDVSVQTDTEKVYILNIL